MTTTTATAYTRKSLQSRIDGDFQYQLPQSFSMIDSSKCLQRRAPIKIPYSDIECESHCLEELDLKAMFLLFEPRLRRRSAFCTDQTINIANLIGLQADAMLLALFKRRLCS
jgi:hypothetical protein